MEFTFLVAGSSEDPYEVLIRKRGDNLTARCTCSAAMNLMHCKHRLNILQGNADNVVSANAADVSKIPALVPGTDVEQALAVLANAETEEARAKQAVKAAKRALARAMVD